jgi:hypothetical protein
MRYVPRICGGSGCAGSGHGQWLGFRRRRDAATESAVQMHAWQKYCGAGLERQKLANRLQQVEGLTQMIINI